MMKVFKDVMSQGFWRCSVSACCFLALSAASISQGLGDESKSDGLQLGKAIRLPATPSLRGPDLADLDGDGLLDLVSGSYEGRIFFARQTKGAKSFEFEPEVALQTAEADIKLTHW